MASARPTAGHLCPPGAGYRRILAATAGVECRAKHIPETLTMKINNRRAIKMTCCGLAALSVMASAVAADVTGAPSPPSGLMQFPNVTVRSAATPTLTPTSGVSGAASARAYKDHDTGRLRGPTPAELLAESLLAPAPTEPQALAILPSVSGGLIAYLGDSGLAYMVATKDESGTVASTCVTDARSEAEAFAASGAQKGDSHDR